MERRQNKSEIVKAILNQEIFDIFITSNPHRLNPGCEDIQNFKRETAHIVSTENYKSCLILVSDLIL